MHNLGKVEEFTDDEVRAAIRAWLRWGKDSYGPESVIQGHGGYFSGEGFAARCLRYHLRKLDKKKDRKSS